MRRLMSVKKCMLFYKEHEDDIECVHCDRSRYVKVINKDETSVTTKVAVKQLCYLPIIPKLKWLFLYDSTTNEVAQGRDM
jgi:hypothetical protein